MDMDDVIYTLRVYFPDAPNTDKPGLRLSESSPRSWDEQVMEYLEDMCLFIPQLEVEYHTGQQYLADANRLAEDYGSKVVVY